MLIAALADHIVKPAFVYRNQWRVGDLLMWDNCTVQHRAIQDYDLAATPANAPNDYGRGSSTLGLKASARSTSAVIASMSSPKQARAKAASARTHGSFPATAKARRANPMPLLSVRVRIWGGAVADEIHGP